jgi:hypothetical protein
VSGSSLFSLGITMREDGMILLLYFPVISEKEYFMNMS